MRLGNPGLAVDAQAETNGRWFDAPAEWRAPGQATPPRLLIASTNTPAFRAAVRTHVPDAGSDDDKERGWLEVVATLLKGWGGIVDADGAEVPYTPEVARAVLLDPDNRRLAAFVMTKANGERSFDAVALEQDAKN